MVERLSCVRMDRTQPDFIRQSERPGRRSGEAEGKFAGFSGTQTDLREPPPRAIFSLEAKTKLELREEMGEKRLVNEGCLHLDQINPDVVPSTNGCEECLKMGSSWVHLRLCLTCGHVGCCDSSPNRHATKHFHATAHPIIRSFQPGEDWAWCYVDEVFLG